jgi:hypothetical protein
LSGKRARLWRGELGQWWMFHSLDRRFLYAAHRINVDYRDNDATKSASATCFFVQPDDGPMLLVTNRHVLDPGFMHLERGHLSIENFLVSGFLPPDFVPFNGLVVDGDIRFSTSDLEDVAVVVNPKLVSRISSGSSVSVQEIPWEMIACRPFGA